MIKITYKEFFEEDGLSIRAEGHAGYAPKGQDIVCAAVSALLQSLAYSVDNNDTGGAIGFDMGENGNVLTVQAMNTRENRAKFELITDGLELIAAQYPEHVQFTAQREEDDALDLQMFAEGGDGTAAAGEGAQAGTPSADLPAQSSDGDRPDCQSSATPSKKTSAGVFQPRHFRGRLFNKSTVRWRSSSESVRKSKPFG